MLREWPEIRQPDEPRRRWFTDDYFDLIVWFGPREEIIGFQLCYDLPGEERALTWWENTGCSHHRVDDGDLQRPYKATPILVEDGHCDYAALARQFKERSRDLEAKVAGFVLEKISGCRAGAEGAKTTQKGEA